jgi:hypothetical protein
VGREGEQGASEASGYRGSKVARETEVLPSRPPFSLASIAGSGPEANLLKGDTGQQLHFDQTAGLGCPTGLRHFPKVSFYEFLKRLQKCGAIR